MLCAQDESEDEIAHSRAIRHDERAQDSAFKPASIQGLETPDHQAGGSDEQRQEPPRRPSPGAFNP